MTNNKMSSSEYNLQSDKRIIYPPIFHNLGVSAFFTDRAVGIDKERVSLLSGIPIERIYMPVQKHTDEVIIPDNSLTSVTGDAVITERDDILIGIQTADCVPILMCDTKNRTVAAVHAGWRGTAKGIVKKTISLYCDLFSSTPGNIVIAFGPSIMSCCYNVGFEVIESIERVSGSGDFLFSKGESWYVDLVGANMAQALSANVRQENIWISALCTSCHDNKFFSYRKSGAGQGRQGAFIRSLP